MSQALLWYLDLRGEGSGSLRVTGGRGSWVRTLSQARLPLCLLLPGSSWAPAQDLRGSLPEQPQLLLGGLPPPASPLPCWFLLPVALVVAPSPPSIASAPELLLMCRPSPRFLWPVWESLVGLGPRGRP